MVFLAVPPNLNSNQTGSKKTPMNNKKCPSCGFINFANADVCKKCEAVLAAPVDSQYNIYNDLHYGASAPVYQPYPTRRKFPILKGFVISIVALAAVSTVRYTLLGRSRINWIEYHPESMDITVMMPSEPTRMEPVTTPLPTGSMTNHSFASVVTGQGSAVFCFVDYIGTGDWLSRDMMKRALDAELSDFLRRTNSQLISKKEITYGGMSGLEFETEPPDNLSPKVARSYGRMLITQTRLYFLSIAAAEGTELFAGRDKFLNMLMHNTDPYRVKEDMSRGN